MKRSPSLLFLVSSLSLVPAVLPAAAQAPAAPGAEKAPDSPFRGDARLDAKVALSTRSQPLGELLNGLEKKLNVPLSASREIADQKVTLYLKERPAADVLTLIGSQLDYQWYKSRGGYELTQNTGAKRREAELRDAELVAAWTATLTRMRVLAQLVGPDGTPPTPDRIAERRRDVSAELEKQDLPEERVAALTEERDALSDLLIPGAGSAISLFKALNPAQLQQLATGTELKLSTTNNTLPAGLANLVHRAFEEMRSSGRVVALGGAPGAGARPEDLPTVGADLTIRFGEGGSAPRVISFSGGPGAGGAGGPGLRLQPNRSRLRLQITMVSQRGDAMRRMALPVSWSPNVTPPKAVEPVLTRSDDPKLNQEVELKFPVPEAGGLQIPGGPGSAPGILSLGGSSPAGYVTVGQILEKLTAATGLEFVSDSFTRARLAPQVVGEKQPVVKILDRIANELDYGWRKQGDLVLLHSRIYFVDRPTEVPNRVLTPWKERVARVGAPTLDDMAALAGALTDAQCKGMQDHWGWYLEGTSVPNPLGPNGIYSNRHHLRFWATLLPPQKQAVLNGGVVAVQQMTPPQRQAFTVALTAPEEMRFGRAQTQLDHPPTSEEILAGGFSIRAQAMQQVTLSGGLGDGNRSIVQTLRPLDGGNGQAPLPKLPDGTELTPVGAPSILDQYTFNYHLAGQETPARTAMLPIPRAQRKP